MKHIKRCDICGKPKVKLWRPYTGSSPLLCTKCSLEGYSGKQSEEYIDQIKTTLYGEAVTMVPAIFDTDGKPFAYGYAPEELFKEWDKLPE